MLKGDNFMKKTRNLSRTLAVIAFVAFNLMLFISALSGDVLIVSIESLNGIVFTLAIAFIFSKNEVVLKVGYGLLILTAISYFTYIFSGNILSLIFGIIIFILLLVSTLTWFISSVLNYFGYLKGDTDVTNSHLAVLLGKLKELLKKQVISSADYASLKTLALGTEFSGAQKVDLIEKVSLMEQGLIDISDVKKTNSLKSS
jgi:hypothetical protein